MSALISSEALSGVSQNSFHFKNGLLFVFGLTLARREEVKKLAVEADLSPLHDLYKMNATAPVPLIVDGKLITDNINSRTTTQTELVILEANLDAPSLLVLPALMDTIGSVFFEPARTNDYLEPNADSPLFNFTGSYQYDDAGTKFVVSGITEVV